ncbi:MAG: asparagine synthetase B family protein, partial [Bacteroidota bacterium]
FVFSSEVRALLASDLVPRKLDQESLSDFFRYQTVHAPRTILQDVHCLMPGAYMTVDRSRSASTVYWKLDPAAAHEAANEDYATVCQSVKERLYQAVERRLVADVPFGAFLSGGIDSSAIVGIMAGVSSEKPRTFSIVFDEPEFSEQPYSDLIAKRFNTEHHPLKLNVNRFLEGLPDALAAMDHPSGDGPNTYVVSEVTRQAGITMALSGLGGDELFAGYDIFHRSLSLEKKRWLNALPRGVRQQAGNVLQRMRPGIAGDKMAGILAQPAVNYLEAYPFSRLTLNERQLRQVLRDAPAPNRVAAWSQQWAYRELDPNRVISTVSALELNTYLQNVLLRDSDQMSMAHALEVRVPFMDHTLVEYVLGLPDRFKRPTSPKRLLIDALDGLLPDAIINRPKMGFTFPCAQWLKHELGAFSAQRLKSLQERSTFNSQGIDLLWRQFQHGDPAVSWSRVWPLIVLGNWLEQHRIDS